MATRRRLNACTVCLTIILGLCVACASVPSTKPRVPPPDRPWRALEKTCHICLETESFNCPIDSVRKVVMGCISIAESLENCGADLRACGKTATIDKAEMQGKVNEQAARADRNERWIWIVAAIGGGLTIVSFLLGAFAL